jgi:hypothetical protein
MDQERAHFPTNNQELVNNAINLCKKGAIIELGKKNPSALGALEWQIDDENPTFLPHNSKKLINILVKVASLGPIVDDYPVELSFTRDNGKEGQVISKIRTGINVLGPLFFQPTDPNQLPPIPEYEYQIPLLETAITIDQILTNHLISSANPKHNPGRNNSLRNLIEASRADTQDASQRLASIEHNHPFKIIHDSLNRAYPGEKVLPLDAHQIVMLVNKESNDLGLTNIEADPTIPFSNKILRIMTAINYFAATSVEALDSPIVWIDNFNSFIHRTLISLSFVPQPVSTTLLTPLAAQLEHAYGDEGFKTFESNLITQMNPFTRKPIIAQIKSLLNS